MLLLRRRKRTNGSAAKDEHCNPQTHFNQLPAIVNKIIQIVQCLIGQNARPCSPPAVH